MTALPEAARHLLDGPHYAQVATLMPDGAPKLDTVWIAREGDRVLLVSTDRTLKVQNLLRDPRVAIVVTHRDNPYQQLQLRGELVEVRPDDDLAVVDAIAHKYLGEPFPQRHHKGRLVLVIAPRMVRYYQSTLKHSPPANPG